MACFITPLAIGIVLSIVKRVFKNISERLKLDVLTTMMLGGSLVLALEHVWHGELVPWPPFLTAMANPEDIPTMINEILTAGSLMSIAVTSTWLVILTGVKLNELKIARIQQTIRTGITK